jgi:hypothetical protein
MFILSTLRVVSCVIVSTPTTLLCILYVYLWDVYTFTALSYVRMYRGKHSPGLQSCPGYAVHHACTYVAWCVLQYLFPQFTTHRSPLLPFVIAKIRSFVSIQKQSIVKAVAKCEELIHIWLRECCRYVSIQKRSIVRVLLGSGIVTCICCHEIQVWDELISGIAKC